MIVFLLVLLLAAPALAWESPPCDTVTSSTTEADPQTVSYTVGTTTTTNRAVIVQTSWRSEGGTILGVTFDGVAMTKIGASAINTTGTDIGTALWVSTGVSSGTYTISADWNGTMTQSTVSAFTCYGVDQVTPVRSGSANTATQSGTSISINVNSAVGDIVIDSLSVGSVNGGAPTIGAGQTEIVTCVANSGDNLDSCASYEPGAATVTFGWSAATSENWAISAFSLQPAQTGVGFGVMRRR